MAGGDHSRIRGLVSVGTVVGLTAWAVHYAIRHYEEFKLGLSWNPGVLALISILLLLHFSCLGLFNQVVLRAFGLRLTFREWFGLAVITTLGNYLLPPRGGAGLRAAYLKKWHHFPLAHFLSTFVAFFVMNLGISALAGLFALSASAGASGETGWTLRIFFLAVLLGAMAVILLPLRGSWFDRPLLRPVTRLIEGWQTIKDRPCLILHLFLLVVVNGVVYGLMIHVAYRSLHMNLALAGTVLVTALLLLTSMISLTPGGLGVQEAVLVFSTGVLGISAAQSLAVAVTIRAVILFWTFVLGPLFSYLLLRQPVPFRIKEGMDYRKS